MTLLSIPSQSFWKQDCKSFGHRGSCPRKKVFSVPLPQPYRDPSDSQSNNVEFLPPSVRVSSSAWVDEHSTLT